MLWFRRRLLKPLLTRRFGALTTETEQRIAAAQVAQLDAWLDGILDATSLEDLIGDETL